MSYILDALRRADAERQRGSVPGLHTQTLSAGHEQESQRHRAAPLWMWMGLGAIAVAAAVMAWNSRDGVQPPPPASETPLPSSPPPNAVAAAETAPASDPGAVLPSHALAAPAAPAMARHAPVKAAAAPQPAKPAAQSRVRPSTARTEAANADPGPDARVYAMNELPEDIRRHLPALAINGSMYSPNPSARFLIVNGQIVHEHDAVGPELTLEQIKLKAAVFKYKGYRYTLNF